MMFPGAQPERQLTEHEWQQLPFSRKVNHVIAKGAKNLANRSKWWLVACAGVAVWGHKSAGLGTWIQMINPMMM
eukprot:NODE_10440_length_335_cov_19.611888_g9528_i0.p3 GENE.NODE_10440_length_335_cov_19.611888_g9528_i0~~NODE_10440_length_335_cov_19.611888_g9528_i0.p3  ORF type:complete len:74 (+),score=17.91 NODE_10440_length_335_cov_19.611888_g9528_i0:60-281(+)